MEDQAWASNYSLIQKLKQRIRGGSECELNETNQTIQSQWRILVNRNSMAPNSLSINSTQLSQCCFENYFLFFKSQSNTAWKYCVINQGETTIVSKACNHSILRLYSLKNIDVYSLLKCVNVAHLALGQTQTPSVTPYVVLLLAASTLFAVFIAIFNAIIEFQ